MPLIWCAISGHGYGHAAQVIPVLNELGRRLPGLTALLRTSVPVPFFEGRLDIPWEVSPVQQDVGCVQQSPIKIDEAATWTETLRFHENWPARVAAESQAMRVRSPACILSDISYLALEAGAQAGLPSVGLCNLSWDRVLAMLADPANPEHGRLIKDIEGSYGKAELFIRLAPGISMPAFRKTVDVAPIARPITGDRARLAAAINTPPEDRLVLVGFGGIALEALPFHAMERMQGYRFLVSGPVPAGLQRCHPALSLGLSFGFLLASCDLLVTKPGYNMVVEAVALGKPVLYVRRYNFADEQSLVDYLHRHGRGLELPLEDFEAGRWRDALDRLSRCPDASLPPPSPTGAAEAADILRGYFLSGS